MGKAGTTAATVRPGLRFLDRLILFVAWIVTCGLVYGLGFYTGKGTQERRLGMEERVVRLPVTAAVPPEGQRPKASNEFSFYETLATQRAADGGRPRDVPQEEPALPAVPPPATAPAGAAAAAAPVGQQLPHPSASPGEPKPAAVASGAAKPPAVPTGAPKPPAGVAAARPALPTPLGAPKPGAAPSPPPRPTTRATAGADGVIPPTPRGARPSAPVPTTPAAATRPGTTETGRTAAQPSAMVALAKPAAPRKPSWTVQASPTRDKQEADRLLGALKARGYDASVVTVRRDGDVWYRLRVGRYASPEQATEAMRKLRGAGVSHAFVASE